MCETPEGQTGPDPGVPNSHVHAPTHVSLLAYPTVTQTLVGKIWEQITHRSDCQKLAIIQPILEFSQSCCSLRHSGTCHLPRCAHTPLWTQTLPGCAHTPLQRHSLGVQTHPCRHRHSLGVHTHPPADTDTPQAKTYKQLI